MMYQKLAKMKCQNQYGAVGKFLKPNITLSLLPWFHKNI